MAPSEPNHFYAAARKLRRKVSCCTPQDKNLATALCASEDLNPVKVYFCLIFVLLVITLFEQMKTQQSNTNERFGYKLISYQNF
jgi:hypothetical protein